MHRREQNPDYTGSGMDFWVGIPQLVGDVNLIFICLALLHHVVMLPCFRHVLVQFDLLAAWRTQWGPPDVLNPSPSTISFFSTSHSISRTLVPFLLTTFLFPKIRSYGPCFAFIRIRSNPISFAVALVRSVSLHGPSVPRSQFFACPIFSHTARIL